MDKSEENKSEKKRSNVLKTVSAQSQPRKPKVGTGKDIFEEQKGDSNDIKATERYLIRKFYLPGTNKSFSLFAANKDENGRIDHTALLVSPEIVGREYEYDYCGRLHKVICGTTIVEQYEYGKYGERLTQRTSKRKPRCYKYNEKLQLIKAGNVTYSYNNKGQLFMKNDQGQVTTYYYLKNGSLCEVRLPDGRKVEYICDPLGRRVNKKIDGNTVETYLWQDLTKLIATGDAEGMNIKVFTYDKEGNPESMTYQEKTYYFGTDQVGTIFTVANERGNTVKEIIHDSFGNLVFDSNKKVVTDIGFASGLVDKDTKLIHFGYRDYDPTIGRFISPDPLGLDGGDVDVYGYGLDDPINFIDRTGLMAEPESDEICQVAS